MKVSGLTAAPAPGGRIALTWTNPAAPAFRGVRLLRAAGAYPTLDDLGTGKEVYQDSRTPAGGAGSFVDGPLLGETVYYYSLVAYDSANNLEASRVSSLALAPYESAAEMYASLPGIYRIFDSTQGPLRNGQGPLRRFLEILGEPFDEVRSTASAMRKFHDIQRVDAALLPLLSSWIGQPFDTTLTIDQQRNEVRYAPHYHRTAGIPAALRAAINRFTDWDAEIKEFVHNVFLSCYPEQLVMYRADNEGAGWPAPSAVNVDVAYEGRVSPLVAQDGRTWLFYHARKITVGTQAPEWGLFAKPGDDAPAWPVTLDRAVHKHPAAVERADGSLWLFHGCYTPGGDHLVPQIRLQALSAGANASPARFVGTNTEPFILSDGQTFELHLGAFQRMVTLRAENYRGRLAATTAAEVAAFLDSELPGVTVTAAADGRLVVTSTAVGSAASVVVPASPIATALGLVGNANGSDAKAAQLTGSQNQPFALADGASFELAIDSGIPRPLVFSKAQFAIIGAATAAEVAAAINSQAPGIASVVGSAVRLTSAAAGAGSRLILSAGTVTGTLGFGAPLPPAVVTPPAPEPDEDEPCAFLGPNGTVWLFWASRRAGPWKIWYARFNSNAWDQPTQLTTGTLPDREPFALFDAGAGRIWVFWSRKKADGTWNVFTRTTTKLDFLALADADWTEAESLPAAAGADNREPAALSLGGGAVELYYASDRTNGWNVWTRRIDPGVQGAESAVTSGSDTRRAPAPLQLNATTVRLYHRSNAPFLYNSAKFPNARTLDGRYSGATAADVRNPGKLSLRGRFEDQQRYTSDTRRPPATDPQQGKNLAGLLSRDAIGIFLTPDTADTGLIIRQTRVFADALQPFYPIQTRLAFLFDEQVYTDYAYSYEQPNPPTIVEIGDQMVDTILSEVVPAAADPGIDIAPAVHFFRTWSRGAPAVDLPDLSAHPPDLNSRLFTARFKEGN